MTLKSLSTALYTYTFFLYIYVLYNTYNTYIMNKLIKVLTIRIDQKYIYIYI